MRAGSGHDRPSIAVRSVVMSIRFQAKQKIKQAVQNVVLPVCYQVNQKRAVDPKLVIFADAHHNSRPAAMELLYRRLKKRSDFRIVEHYLDYGTAGAAAVAKHSTGFMQLYAAAAFVVICDNFLPAASCRKREETKVIQLWHACGCYKKFGYDAKDDIPENYHGANVYRNADLVTVSGEAAVRPFSSAMRLPESCVKPLGVSRTDLYFRDGWIRRCRQRFYEEYPQAKDKKIVLWAPTFRGNAGIPELLNLNLEKLQEELGENWLVLARLHPHMADEPGSRFRCRIPTEELYPVTDVLIADYSSLIYEYLMFRKPLVLYVPDLEEYRSRRGFYMDIAQIPGQIVTREKELAGEVKKADQKQAAQDEKLDAFLSDYMGACDGKATERIVEWMLG